MAGLASLQEENESRVPCEPCEGALRRQPSANQEDGIH